MTDDTSTYFADLLDEAIAYALRKGVSAEMIYTALTSRAQEIAHIIIRERNRREEIKCGD